MAFVKTSYKIIEVRVFSFALVNFIRAGTSSIDRPSLLAARATSDS